MNQLAATSCAGVLSSTAARLWLGPAAAAATRTVQMQILSHISFAKSELQGILILHPCLLVPAIAVSAEFVLTGLSNADGNSKNHEIGVCLPHFTLELTASCKLTIKPMYAGNAYVSLMQVGETDPGQPIIPRATDSILAVNEYVTNKMGYYYLRTTRCPQIYQANVKGAKLLASGTRQLGGVELAPGCGQGSLYRRQQQQQ